MRARIPKFKRGDVVFIRNKNMRAGPATFTVTYRKFDRQLYWWFYRDDAGPLYSEDLLVLAAHAQKEKGKP